MGLYSGTGVIFGMLTGLHIWGRIFGGLIKGGGINRVLRYDKTVAI